MMLKICNKDEIITLFSLIEEIKRGLLIHQMIADAEKPYLWLRELCAALKNLSLGSVSGRKGV